MNTYQVRVYWSDESDGNLDSCFDVKAHSIDHAWDKALKHYFVDPYKAQKNGEFMDEHFIFDMFFDVYTSSYRFKDEINPNQLEFNEDGEIENVRTYTIQVLADGSESE